MPSAVHHVIAALFISSPEWWPHEQLEQQS